jgi:hypothetical protein
MMYRLGIIAGFTALFALALTLTTRVKRAEIFTATTAPVLSLIPCSG